MSSILSFFGNWKTDAETPTIIPENLGNHKAPNIASEEAPRGHNQRVCVTEPPWRSQHTKSRKVQCNLSLGEKQIPVTV